jgi:hypothetical protein
VRSLVKIVLLGGAAIGAWVVIVIIINMIVVRHNATINMQRLRSLQSDGVLHCPIAAVTPWREPEDESADEAGYGPHGAIFYLGFVPTAIERVFTIKNANAGSLISAFSQCAQANGWAVSSDVLSGVSGRKSSPDGWNARLHVFYGTSTPFIDQPYIQVHLEADVADQYLCNLSWCSNP